MYIMCFSCENMMRGFRPSWVVWPLLLVCLLPAFADNEARIETRIDALLSGMTLEEKIGQMHQINAIYRPESADSLKEAVRKGHIGSILNEDRPDHVNELQRIAVEESRLGIPVIFGMDVIHGYRTIFPIPLGQAATWNPEMVQKAARVAATEAASTGLNWTFAPMVDLCRDPRWGRIAEGYGEDPFLGSCLAAAAVHGFQTHDLSANGAIAACAKHFAGYGAVEGGRDYNTVILPENVLRDVWLPAFQSSVKAGAATLMCSFNEINGVPSSGNAFLLKEVLRDEWKFDGFVVSDWASIAEMVEHGFCADRRDAAKKAVQAGVDMEMVSGTYQDHLAALVASGDIDVSLLDEAVRRILRIKFRLGLFDHPCRDRSAFPEQMSPEFLETARQCARQSVVMLKNLNGTLPLSANTGTLAVIGPLADDRYEALGTWHCRGREEDTVSPLTAIRNAVGPDTKIIYEQTLSHPRDRNIKRFIKAIQACDRADAVLVFVGEESALSGESRCRAFLTLTGAQSELIERVSQTGKPVILVVYAGRPLAIGREIDHADAVLYAWHPGTMAGPALADLIFGTESPSGKLPVTFPQTAGQIPVYYNHKNTGRPPSGDVTLDMLQPGPRRQRLPFESYYLDIGHKPLFPFGFGLSYTTFEYANLNIESNTVKNGGLLKASVDVRNTGHMEADEIVQCYIRDLAGSLTRPVRELKAFKRIRLKPGESRNVAFNLDTAEMGFYSLNGRYVVEPGDFQLWIGPSSAEGMMETFRIIR